MLDKIGKWLSDLVRWTVLIAIATVALYLVCTLTLEQFCPKYYFSVIKIGGTAGKFFVYGVRCDKITGEIVIIVSDRRVIDKEWKPKGAVEVSPKEYEFIPIEPAK